MKDHHDLWYLRLPDGRIVKAKSTASVRHHVEAGNIPLNSMARRRHDEEWVGLAWIAEFADLGNDGRRAAAVAEAPSAESPNGDSSATRLKGGISARLDPMRLQTVGIRGLVDELVAAFDSTVSTGKLVVAAAVAFVGSLAAYLVLRLSLTAYAEGVWLAQVLAGIASLFVLAVITALLTRQTHLELSRMRPVPPSEARAGAGRFVTRVFLGYALTFGVGVGLLMLLGRAPGWVADATGSAGAAVAEVVQTAAWVGFVLVAVAVFAMLLLALLVAPILIVEECSLGDAVREWRSILAEHRVRVIVYEGMAVALAAVAALPVALPVYLTLHYGPALPPAAVNWVGGALPVMLTALAASPAIAFLAVANLFIYLNLRYEYTPAK